MPIYTYIRKLESRCKMKEFVEKLISRLREATYDMEICEEQFDMNSPYFMDVDYKMVKFDDAKTIINELAEEYNNGWIPCSEGLPNVGMTVLCYWKQDNRYDNTTSYYYTLMYRNEDYQWISDFGMCNGAIIAWQPLPQPYKPQKEAEWKNKVMKHFTNVE
jgi:hypothetical protein